MKMAPRAATPASAQVLRDPVSARETRGEYIAPLRSHRRKFFDFTMVQDCGFQSDETHNFLHEKSY
jgi:hypothetical protein